MSKTTSSGANPTDAASTVGTAPGGPGRLRRFLFGSVGQRLTVAVSAAVAAGIGGTILVHTRLQEADILAANERTLHQVTESALRGLETIMLNGYADAAPYYAERLRDVRDIDDFRILRADGREAFLDNRTVAAINERFGTTIFPVKPVERLVQVLPPDQPELRQAVTGRRWVTYYRTEADGSRHITVLSPIALDQRCMVCHDEHREVNAVIKLTTSLAPVEADIRATWLRALSILGFSVSVILVFAYLLVRRSIIRPIETVSEAMARVADGHLDQAVPVIGRDELAQMARSFNDMAAQLLRTYDGLQDEQNKLTTIIHAAIEGIVVTDDAGNVVLVNPAAEKLLDKPTWRVISDGFLNLIEAPGQMQSWLEAGHGAADVLHKGRILNVQVARITGENGETVGSSALLRDITQERRLEQRLRSLSTTDALTGLWNRRHLDQTLEFEFERAQRYGLDLAVLLFDIDHFKAFNDTYGHEFGDRVLRAVAERVAEAVRQVDVACRYGGEEFVVVLPETGIDGAVGMAERLRQAIAAAAVDGRSVTVTIGVASIRHNAPAKPQGLIEAADKALYQGKKGGRNRVVRADPLPEGSGA